MSLDERQIAAREQFDRQSRSYGTSHILADVSDVSAALSGVPLPHCRRALDVATGGGHTAAFLAEQGWEVTASDLSPAMLERAKELAAGRGLAIATALHEAERLPYADGFFGLVACRVAAHHFSDPRAFLYEVARVLEPGGSLLLIDGSVPDGEPDAEEWIHCVEKLRDPSHGRFLSPLAWSALVGESGLKILSCDLTPLKQPDLEWYFEAAATSEKNRQAVRELVAGAPAEVRQVFRIAEEDGKITWWWPRLTLLALKPA